MAERKNVIPAGGTDKARVQVRGDRGASFLIALAFMLIVTMVVAVALSAAVTNAERIGQHSDDEQAYFSVASASDLVSGLIEGSGANTVGTLALKNPTSGDELSVFGYEEGADKTGLSEWVVTTARKVYASKSGNASESSGRVSPQSDDDAEDDGYRQTWTVDTNLGEASNANALPVDVTLSMGDDYSITVTAQVADAEATDYSNAIKKTFRAHSVENGGFAWGEGTEIVETLYTVTFVSEGGEELSSVQYHYGTEAEDIVRPAAPEKEATAEYTYTFSGWSPEIADVTGDATYTATYTATKRKYDVTWKDEDGTKLATNQVEYGSTPSYGGDTPTKASTAQYEYAFSGWSPAVSAVTGPATYTATYNETLRKYEITWLDDDDEVLKTERVEYGTVPSYNGTPAKESTVEYVYEFSGWTPEVVAVDNDASYKASFEASKRKYTIRFLDDDGATVLRSASYPYGTPVADIETPDVPSKESTEDGDYSFVGWDPEIADVTGDADYRALYDENPFYTVSFEANASDATLSFYSAVANKGNDYKVDAPTGTRGNFVLEKFTENADGTGTEFSPSAKVNGNAKYYAQWKGADATEAELEAGTHPSDYVIISNWNRGHGKPFWTSTSNPNILLLVDKQDLVYMVYYVDSGKRYVPYSNGNAVAVDITLDDIDSVGPPQSQDYAEYGSYRTFLLFLATYFDESSGPITWREWTP